MEKMAPLLSPELEAELANVARQTGREREDLIREAVKTYLQGQRLSRFLSIGAGASDEVTGENSEDWLKANWRPE